MKKILMIVLAGLILSGCTSKPKESITACVETSDNTVITTNFISNDKGAIIRSEQSLEIPLEEDQVELFQTQIEAEKEALEAIEGVTYEFSIVEKTATIKVILDVTKLSDESLNNFGFTDDYKDDNGNFSAQKYSDFFKEMDIECTKK